MCSERNCDSLPLVSGRSRLTSLFIISTPVKTRRKQLSVVGRRVCRSFQCSKLGNSKQDTAVRGDGVGSYWNPTQSVWQGPLQRFPPDTLQTIIRKRCSSNTATFHEVFQEGSNLLKAFAECLCRCFSGAPSDWRLRRCRALKGCRRRGATSRPLTTPDAPTSGSRNGASVCLYWLLKLIPNGMICSSLSLQKISVQLKTRASSYCCRYPRLFQTAEILLGCQLVLRPSSQELRFQSSDYSAIGPPPLSPGKVRAMFFCLPMSFFHFGPRGIQNLLWSIGLLM
jgi:hypothetical protein